MSPEILEQVRSLYKRGLYVQAYRCGEGHGPLKSWTGTTARIPAGRLAYQLGAPRLGRALQYLAWRSDPEDPEAIYYHAWDAIRSHGLLAAWEMQEKYGDLVQAPPTIRADFCALRASTFGWLRDFEADDEWLSRAEVIAPDSPWIQVERSALLRTQDRYEESLAAAERALTLRPWFRPGVEATAKALELLARQDDALELLAEAANRLESASIVATLAALQNDLGRHDEARKNLDRISELAPSWKRASPPGS